MGLVYIFAQANTARTEIEKDWIELNRRFGDWMQRGHEMMVRHSSCRLAVQLQQVEQEQKSCRECHRACNAVQSLSDVAVNEMQRLKTFQ